jgi:hypothetical protein
MYVYMHIIHIANVFYIQKTLTYSLEEFDARLSRSVRGRPPERPGDLNVYVAWFCCLDGMARRAAPESRFINFALDNVQGRIVWCVLITYIRLQFSLGFIMKIKFCSYSRLVRSDLKGMHGYCYSDERTQGWFRLP